MALFTIAWILIFFDWNIYLTETAALGLLPDFIGWLLLWLVLHLQKQKSIVLHMAWRWLCPIMAGLTGLRYFVDALGLIGDVGIAAGCLLGLAFGLPAVIMAALLLQDWMPKTEDTDPRLCRLFFWMLAAGEAGTYLLLFEPFLALIPLLAALVGKVGLYVCLRPAVKRLLVSKKKKR